MTKLCKQIAAKTLKLNEKRKNKTQKNVECDDHSLS